MSGFAGNHALACWQPLDRPPGQANAAVASRYIGAITSPTAHGPTAGTWQLGDWCINTNGTIGVCTVAGTPGTWVAMYSDGNPPETLLQTETTAPATPASGTGVQYVKSSDSKQYFKSDTGIEYLLSHSVETYILGDNRATLTTGAGLMQVPIEGAYLLESVAARVSTAPTGATLIVDVNKNGTTIYGTQSARPTIAISGNLATVGAATVTTFAANDYLTRGHRPDRLHRGRWLPDRGGAAAQDRLMAAVTAITGTVSTANVNSYAATAFTPTAGHLLVVWVIFTASVDAAPTLTSNANGLTFTVFRRNLADTSLNLIVGFVGDQLVPGSPASTILTANVPTDPATGCVIGPLTVSGMTRTGLSAIRQSAGTDNNLAAAGTPSLSFAAAALTANPVVGVVTNNTNPSGITPPAVVHRAARTGHHLRPGDWLRDRHPRLRPHLGHRHLGVHLPEPWQRDDRRTGHQRRRRHRVHRLGRPENLGDPMAVLKYYDSVPAPTRRSMSGPAGSSGRSRLGRRVPAAGLAAV